MCVKTIDHRLQNSIVTVFSAIALLGIAPLPAQAFAPVTIGFSCATPGASPGTQATCDAGENQFKARVEAVANNPGQVLFRFMNTVRPNGSSISASILGAFFEDTGLQSLASVAQVNFDNQGIVDFRPSNSNLPGAPGFTANFSARANPVNPGLTVNGINLGEELGILMNITSGFANPLDAVITDLQQGGLRLGLRANVFGGANVVYGVSFVNSAVPEPMTILGTGAAIGLGVLMKRRQMQRRQER